MNSTSRPVSITSPVISWPRIEPVGRGRAAADHVLVGAADVGRDDLEDHAVLASCARRCRGAPRARPAARASGSRSTGPRPCRRPCRRHLCCPPCVSLCWLPTNEGFREASAPETGLLESGRRRELTRQVARALGHVARELGQLEEDRRLARRVVAPGHAAVLGAHAVGEDRLAAGGQAQLRLRRLARGRARFRAR